MWHSCVWLRTLFQILKFIFGIKLYMFRTVPLSIIRSFFTVHTAMVYVIQVCWQLASSIRKERLYVQWKTPDDGQRNCPKHVEFYFKTKFEKLVHLVGFSVRIYHDARSPDRQTTICLFLDIMPAKVIRLTTKICLHFISCRLCKLLL